MTKTATTNLDRLIAPKDLSHIEWRLLRAYPSYEVSEYGHVRRVSRACGAIIGKLLSPKLHEHGYPRYDLRRGGQAIGCEAHRLVASEFLPPQPPGTEVSHKDGTPANNHRSNLCWKTHRENEADKKSHGTSPLGEKNGAAILTNADIRSIREYRRTGESLTQIAARFQIAFQTVSKIVRGQRWGHVI